MASVVVVHAADHRQNFAGDGLEDDDRRVAHLISAGQSRDLIGGDLAGASYPACAVYGRVDAQAAPGDGFRPVTGDVQVASQFRLRVDGEVRGVQRRVWRVKPVALRERHPAAAGR
ncbi:MAG: hypothetical protein U0452_12000 [Anaerolineae bacterium]